MPYCIGKKSKTKLYIIVNLKIENNKLSAINIIKKINSHLNHERKKDVKFVFFLSIFSSLADSVSIALLVPFVSFFVNPDNYLFNDLFKGIFIFFNISKEKDILTTVASSFIFIVLLSSLIKLTYIKYTNSLTDNITSDFRIKIFKFLINQDFSYHLKHGSNAILSNLTQKTGAFTTVFFFFFYIINSILISTAIIIVLIINEPFYTPLIIFSIILFFLIIFKIKSKSVMKKGQSVNYNQDIMVEVFNNTVGYIPEMIIYNLKNFFYKILSKRSDETAKLSAEVRTIAASPRIYLETFVITLVVIIIYLSNFNERAIEENIAYLAILAFASQKCLPLINNIYTLAINFKNVVPTVVSFLTILGEKKDIEIINQEYDQMNFKKKINLKNISFQYSKNLPNILNKFSCEILKGEKVVIKGKTGSGKSTLVNIISGLLNPSFGKYIIDDVLIDKNNLKNWQRNLSIVPQLVFLDDSTVLENIAIAIDKKSIDVERVKRAAKIAQIDTFIESLPNKYEEKVGERGTKFSGGQRQRMGIARALYRGSKVIILDEPTNALDSDTESLVMDSITKLDKEITLIMISHSDKSLKYFDKIINLDKIN